MNKTRHPLWLAVTFPALFAMFFMWRVTKNMELTTLVRSVVCLSVAVVMLLVVGVLYLAGKKQSPDDILNREQKMARFVIINFTVAIVLALIACGLIYLKTGSLEKASAGIGFLGLCGISGFTPIMYRQDAGAVDCDERDVLINRKAAVAGFAMAYLFVGLACMLPFTIMGSEATIQVTWLPLIFAGAGILNFYVHSITLLVLYGRGGHTNE